MITHPTGNELAIFSLAPIPVAIWIRKEGRKDKRSLRKQNKGTFFAPPFNDKWRLFVPSKNPIRFLRGFVSRSRSINLNGYRSRGEKMRRKEGRGRGRRDLGSIHGSEGQ